MSTNLEAFGGPADPVQAAYDEEQSKSLVTTHAKRKELLVDMPTIATLREGDQTNSILDYDPKEYRLAPYLSQSALKMIGDAGQGSEEFKSTYITGEIVKETTPAQQWGTDLEDWLFENKSNNVRIPREVLNLQGHRKGIDWKNWQKEQLDKNPDAKLLTDDEYHAKMGGFLWAERNVREHEMASLLLSQVDQRHATIFYEGVQDFLYKVQLDGLNLSMDVIWDLKSSKSRTPEEFAKDIFDWGYYIQAFIYREALRSIFGYRKLDYVFLVVHNKPPYEVFTVSINEQWFNLAEAQVHNLAKRLRKCYETGNWHQPGHGQIVPVAVPDKAWRMMS